MLHAWLSLLSWSCLVHFCICTIGGYDIVSVPVFVEHRFFLDQNLTVVPQDFGIIITVITLRQVLELLPHE